ncbi:MAG: S8 family peptidase [Bacteroidota bacterium]|nr:S8 family peptidase [Bacteroidota bacterium]
MAEKNLPIKFFQKRQKDEMDTEGGGGGTPPPWLLTEPQALYERSMYVRDVLDSISTKLTEKRKNNNYIPSVLKLKVNEDALAKTYRREIGNLFNAGKLNTIGVSGEDEVLVKIDNENDLQAIVKNFAKVDNAYPSYSTVVGISAISNVEEFKPVIEVEASNDSVIKVKLFNYGNGDLDSILIKAFETYCSENKLQFERAVYSGDLNIYRLDGVTQDVLEDLKDFDGVQLVTEMPTYDITMDEIATDDTVLVRQPKAGVNYPIVGVLDSGIADIPHLSPWLHGTNITYYQDEDVNKQHGTFVAGVLIYGDELEGEEYTGFEGCKLFEAIVIPNKDKQKIYESELIEQIRDAISRNDNIKIWNLSLGTDREADLYEFSDFAKALDEIQEQHDVLICKSAGNCNNFKINAPKSRIAKSADTVRGLVVGSVGHDRNPSSFSRLGPGPSHLIKPDVVHIGGAASLNARNGVEIVPVKSFSPGGSIVKQIGTSFSTPRISAIAAGLDSLLNEKFNPILLKALIIHSARYPEEMRLGMADKINAAGFGLPSNIKDILFNEPNEITLVLQDTLEKGNFIDILDFPFPQSMIDDDGYYYGEVTVTLVTAPILDVSQGAEYCQSNISVMFGSYDEKVERDTTKPIIKNPIGAGGRQNVLSTAVYSKVATKNMDTAFATERMLVSYGDKYQPVKKWSVNFDEFTESNKEKYLKAPKNWYLKLEGLFRHFTEIKCEMQRIIPSQEFCLMLTIKDTKKKGNIYNEVTQLLNNFNFIHSNVRIKEEVRVRLNS